MATTTVSSKGVMTDQVIPNGYYHSVLFVCVLLCGTLTVVGRGKDIPTFHHKTLLLVRVLLLQLLHEQGV